MTKGYGYPKRFLIEHMDGEGLGEAIKDQQGEPWTVHLAGGGFSWYGSITQVKIEIKRWAPDATFLEVSDD